MNTEMTDESKEFLSEKVREMTEIGIKYKHFEDDRPLTNETLEELGFLFGLDIFINGIRLSVGTDNTVFIKGCLSKWKTVGSVRMLIEALKGYE